jgi:putative MATE family efflux protein
MAATAANSHIVTGSLTKALRSLAIPGILQMGAMLLFELADMFWIGRTSQTGVAAVGAATYMIWAVKALTTISGSGASVFIGKAAGQQNNSTIQAWFWRGLGVGLILGIGLMLAGIPLRYSIAGLMHLQGETLQFAADYMFWLFCGLPLLFVMAFLDQFIRLLGDAKTPLRIVGFALLLNIVLDPLLIFGWWIFPELGVAGSAIASVIAQGVAVGLFITTIRKRKIINKLILPGRSDFASIVKIFRIGAPIGFTGASFSFIYLFITRAVAQSAQYQIPSFLTPDIASNVQIAAMGVGQRWESAAYYVCMAVGLAVTTLVSQNLGANQPARARRAALLATRYLVYFTFGVSLAFVFGGDILAAILTSDPQIIAATAHYLAVVGYFEITMAFEFGLEGAFIGAGRTLTAFLISFPLTAVRIPVAWYFGIHLQYGVDGIWWTIGTTMMLKGMLFAWWFFKGNWMNKRDH